jgi:hypothetical protein
VHGAESPHVEVQSYWLLPAQLFINNQPANELPSFRIADTACGAPEGPCIDCGCAHHHVRNSILITVAAAAVTVLAMRYRVAQETISFRFPSIKLSVVS